MRAQHRDAVPGSVIVSHNSPRGAAWTVRRRDMGHAAVLPTRVAAPKRRSADARVRQRRPPREAIGSAFAPAHADRLRPCDPNAVLLHKRQLQRGGTPDDHRARFRTGGPLPAGSRRVHSVRGVRVGVRDIPQVPPSAWRELQDVRSLGDGGTLPCRLHLRVLHLRRADRVRSRPPRASPRRRMGPPQHLWARGSGQRWRLRAGGPPSHGTLLPRVTSGQAGGEQLRAI
mmetsp:Transcript_68738/g.157873  ORF Transcript_68738/g.157873 Transcript_68738/m.157873 type:complete len:229 (+) Transcript_68738:909-1595(+)